MLETNPLVEVNLSKGTVKIAAPFSKRLKLGGDKPGQDAPVQAKLSGRDARTYE